MTAVALIGLMGAGKTTVGRLVAAELGCNLVDVDVAILKRTGRTARELWEAGGEKAYRHLEIEVVLQTLRSRSSFVLATPGGAVLDATVRSALATAFVVWLRAAPAVLSARVGEDDHRPLLGQQPMQVLSVMAKDRSELYDDLADAVADTDDRNPQEVAWTVVSEFRRQCPDG